MLSELARVLLRILAVTHIFLLIWTYGVEYDTCRNVSLPTLVPPSDYETSEERKTMGKNFHAAALFDVFCILFILIVSNKTQGKHDIRGFARWVPAWMIAYNIAFRARHTYGDSSDKQSCSSLNCPTTAFSFNLTGCKTFKGLNTFFIDWQVRSNWCAIPTWYSDENDVTRVCPGGLINTPDVASCYRYGCEHTPQHRYIAVRMILWSSVVLAFLALTPYCPMEGRKLQSQSQKKFV